MKVCCAQALANPAERWICLEFLAPFFVSKTKGGKQLNEKKVPTKSNTRKSPLIQTRIIKRIPLPEVPRLQSLLKPKHPLRRRTMRKALRHYMPLRLFLQLVIANGISRP